MGDVVVADIETVPVEIDLDRVAQGVELVGQDRTRGCRRRGGYRASVSVGRRRTTSPLTPARPPVGQRRRHLVDSAVSSGGNGQTGGATDAARSPLFFSTAGYCHTGRGRSASSASTAATMSANTLSGCCSPLTSTIRPRRA